MDFEITRRGLEYEIEVNVELPQLKYFKATLHFDTAQDVRNFARELVEAIDDIESDEIIEVQRSAREIQKRCPLR